MVSKDNVLSHDKKHTEPATKHLTNILNLSVFVPFLFYSQFTLWPLSIMFREKKLSELEREHVMAFHENGMIPAEITWKLNGSPSTMLRYLIFLKKQH